MASSPSRQVKVADVPTLDRGHGLIHLFPRDPRYRLSGQIPPVAGDIARCGRVKKSDSHAGRDMPATCVVCLELRGDIRL